MRWFYAFAAAALVIGLLWRQAAAWWCLDLGNLAFVRGDKAVAAAYFSRGLEWEPEWNVLLEDHGRAVVDSQPVIALDEFRRADCGEPCLAEAGDAESRLGNPLDAINDYLAAHAVGRLAQAVSALSDSRRYDEAIALERTLASRLGNGMLAQADLATAYDTIGMLDEKAATSKGERAAEYRADAIRSFRRASELAPLNDGYLLELGFAEEQWGDRRAAIAAFERVLDHHPHQPDAERGLSTLGVPPSVNR